MTAEPTSHRQLVEGLVFLAFFVLTIPGANWMIGHVGTHCVPNGPCLMPVAPGIEAPTGIVMIGLSLVLRDLVQRRLGVTASFAAILVGGIISALLAPPSLVIASVVAFLSSELADLAVYTPLQRRRFITAVVLSGLVGLVIDSAVFLQLAFGELTYLPGQVIGKTWMILATIPVLRWLRDRDRRQGLMPA